MPDDLEAGAEGAADSGLDTGSDAGGQEPDAGSAQTPSAQQQTPSYMTREQFEEAMSGYSSSHQERLDRVAGSFSQMQEMIKQMMEAQKPQPPPLVPDAKDLENIDARGMRDLLAGITGKYDMTLKEMQQKMEQQQQKWEQARNAERLHVFFKEQAASTAKQHPMLQKPFGNQLLNRLIVADLETSRGDYKKVNVPAIGQALNAYLEEEVKQRVAAMTKAAQAGQAAPAPGGKPGGAKPLPKGTPAKPADNTGGGVTLRNFREKQREFLSRMMGGED